MPSPRPKTPIVPSDAYEQYITKLYEIVFDRTPAAEELNYWVQQLKKQKGKPKSIASGFVGSAEYKKPIIESLFLKLLDREVDETGLKAWMASNMNTDQIAIELLCSAEFIEKTE